MSKKFFLPLICITSILTTACSNEQSVQETKPQQQNEQQKTKKEAFDFLAYNTDGKEVKLSDFKGKKVYINVWASWCGPCLREIPELEKVYQELKNDDSFVFLSITSPSDAMFKNNNPADENKETILAKAKELNVTYPVLFDVNDRFLINYNIRSFPTHIFINSDGTISNQTIGMLNEETLKEQIKKIK